MTDSTRHVRSRAKALLATPIALAAVAAALSVPSAANAATLGSTHVAESSQAGVFCGGFPNCAYAQTSLLDGTVRAPFDGRIRTWSVHLMDAGSLQLLVLRRRSDGSFKVVDASTPRTTTTDGVKRFGADLNAHKGNFIGLNLLDEDVGIQVLNPRAERSKGFMPAFDVGGVQRPYAPFGSTFNELQFNAQLRH